MMKNKYHILFPFERELKQAWKEAKELKDKLLQKKEPREEEIRYKIYEL